MKLAGGSTSICISAMSRERIAMAVILVAYFVLLLVIGLVRHWSNMTNLNDLGVFDQAVWGTLHGEWFLNTNNRWGMRANWLGSHFNPFLLAFVPLYQLWPAAEWFAIAQAFALSVAAWPVFLLASRIFSSERTGIIWALVYLFNPFLMNGAAWDFHPVTLAVPLITTGLLAVEMRKLRLLLVCCALLLLVQEQCGITVAGIGALWAIRNKQWKSGALIMIIGCLHAALVLGVIMPALSPTGSHPFINGKGHLNRYGWLGKSLGEIIGTMLLHPLQVVSTILGRPDAILYLILLTLPLLGMFLGSPLWLLPGMADFAANILSSINMPRGVMSYHSVTLVPVLTVAAIYGSHRLASSRVTTYLTTRIPRYLLCSTLVFSYMFSPLPLPGSSNFWAPAHLRGTPDSQLPRLREIITDNSVVSAQANIAAHFSQRREIYLFPEQADKSDTIVLWLDSPTTHVLSTQFAIGSTAHHLQMRPAAYLASIESLLRNRNFGVVVWEDPWLVLSRGVKGRGEAEPAIRQKLLMLRKTWAISEEEYAAALGSLAYPKL